MDIWGIIASGYCGIAEALIQEQRQEKSKWCIRKVDYERLDDFIRCYLQQLFQSIDPFDSLRKVLPEFKDIRERMLGIQFIRRVKKHFLFLLNHL